MKTTIIKTFITTALLILIGFGAQQAFAFTAPTQSAPGGNTTAPVNVGPNTQEKIGRFVSKSLGTLEYMGSGESIGAVNTVGASEFCLDDYRDPTFTIFGPIGVLRMANFLTNNQPGANANCIDYTTGWGSSLPSGTNGQTLRNSNNQWVASNMLRNDGSKVTVKNELAPDALWVLGGLTIRGVINKEATVGDVLTAVNTNGRTEWKPVPTPTLAIKYVEGDISGSAGPKEAVCPWDYPIIIGGGADCYAGDHIESSYLDLGPAGETLYVPGKWHAKCTSGNGTAKLIQKVYAVCAKASGAPGVPGVNVDGIVQRP